MRCKQVRVNTYSMKTIRLTRGDLRQIIKEVMEGTQDFDPEFDNHFWDCEDDSPSDGPYIEGVTACRCEQRKSDLERYGTDRPDDTPLMDPMDYAMAGFLPAKYQDNIRGKQIALGRANRRGY